MKYMSNFIIYLYAMEKLIELLNEAIRNWLDFQWYDILKIEYYSETDIRAYYDKTARAYYNITYEDIISKRAGFIKRLIGNDKIDLKKMWYDDDWFSWNLYERWIAFVEDYDNDTYKVLEFYSPYLQLLMLLSIQDNPIEFLISILK